MRSGPNYIRKQICIVLHSIALQFIHWKSYLSRKHSADSILQWTCCNEYIPNCLIMRPDVVGYPTSTSDSAGQWVGTRPPLSQWPPPSSLHLSVSHHFTLDLDLFPYLCLDHHLCLQNHPYHLPVQNHRHLDHDLCRLHPFAALLLSGLVASADLSPLQT